MSRRFERAKQVLYPLYDRITLPFTWAAARHMRILRRLGLVNFPRSKQALLDAGVFPLFRHFYDPQFHPDDLPPDFGGKRPLPGIDLRTEGQLNFLESLSFQTELGKFRSRETPVAAPDVRFDLENTLFGPGDVDFYYQIIRKLKPRRIVEIGSGNSTMVALAAIQRNGEEDGQRTCRLTCIEPYPWFRHREVEMIASRVEEVDRRIFQALEADDILFIDSSHMLRPRGDVDVEFLQILPSLAAGVVVHVHDIFTPFDYPAEWVKGWPMFWSEQYLLEALLSGSEQFEILAALFYLNQEHPAALRRALPLLEGSIRQPYSFWMRKVQ